MVQFKLVSLEYFMDELQSWEVNELLECLKYADQASWEQTRWLMYVVAQVNSRKQLKLQDMMHFPWDDENDRRAIPLFSPFHARFPLHKNS